MIGIDVLQISRMRKSLENAAFKSRVFTEAEIAYCNGKPDPIQSFAGLFCAKEAAVKAVKTGFGTGVMPQDIEISHDETGAPVIVAHGAFRNALCGYAAHVSISHDGDTAVAAVYLTKSNGENL